MNVQPIRIGTRESQLAVWQATLVAELLNKQGLPAELVYIRSDGDADLKTPLYEMGVQGIFTRALDQALLSNRIDLAVHSMKDVPVVPARGLQQAAVLERASSKDLLVPHPTFTDPTLLTPVKGTSVPDDQNKQFAYTIATSSLRRKAQWLNRFPSSSLENLRGNVNTRLRKLAESNWHGAIFAAAGLDRIGLRPNTALELDWMVPAPAQGAIMVMARLEDYPMLNHCKPLDHEPTAFCVKAERDFLRTLKGGCTAPVSALCTISNDTAYLHGQVLSLDGTRLIEVKMDTPVHRSYSLGVDAALDVLDRGGDLLMKEIRKDLE